MKKKVFIIDDSVFTRKTIKLILEKENYIVIGEAQYGASALINIRKEKPDIITLDNILPDTTGFDLLEKIKKESSTSRVIVISALNQKLSIDKAKALGAIAYLTKPFEPNQLIEVMNKVVNQT